MRLDLRTPEYRHWLWALYLPLYLAAFFWVEGCISPDIPYWISYWPLVDDAIPFCPPFVLAYYFWFPFMVVTGLYLGARHPDCFRRYMKFIALGFSASIVFFLILPNGQDLRPATLAEDDLFTRMIGAIYADLVGKLVGKAKKLKSDKLQCASETVNIPCRLIDKA
ncbi:MAG: hypothetical protein EOM66_08100, partial [Clostridia bacterium]|nr:hypothetical protein [Clostridia bacterium]